MGFKMPRPDTAFSLDPDRKSQGGRAESAGHLAFIRKLPCCACGSRAPSEAAHIRYAEPLYRKGNTGIGTKPDDHWTVPLCASCHRTGPDAQHGGNERSWWMIRGIDPLELAVALRGLREVDAGEAAVARIRGKGERNAGQS